LKRSQFAVSLVLATLVGSLASCSHVLDAPLYQQGTVTHVVLCYLKEPGNAEARKKLLAVRPQLRQIPGVYDVEAGLPIKSPRPVVVSDYDVAYVITFRDVQSMEAYGSHPKHVKAAEEVLKPLTSKIVVYDILNQ
jgi:hypothetical protein